MATYTIGNATWTNGSHKVSFSVLAGTTRHAVYLSGYDSLIVAAGSQGHCVVWGQSTGWTNNNALADPTDSYIASGVSHGNYLRTSTGTGTYVYYQEGGSDYDAANSRVVTNGGTKLTVLIYTVGNNVGDWLLQPNGGASALTTYQVALPATPDGWNEVTLTLPNAFSGVTFQRLRIQRTGLAAFTTGQAFSIAAAYVHDGDNGIVLQSDTISPDAGVTNFTVDKVVNNANASNVVQIVYTKEAFTGTTGVKSTSRTEAITGVSRDLSATVAGVSTTSSPFIGRAKKFLSTVSVSSVVGSFATVLHPSWISSIIGTSSTSGSVGAERGMDSYTMSAGAVYGVDPDVYTAVYTEMGGVSSVSAEGFTTSRSMVASIHNDSIMSSVLGDQTYKLFNTSIAGKSKLVQAVSILPTYPLGPADWTNGSYIVDGTGASGTVMEMRLFSGTNALQAGGGFTWYNNSDATININDSWGVGATSVNGITSQVSYTVKRLPNVRNGVVADTYQGADHWLAPDPAHNITGWGMDGSYCDAAVFKPTGGTVAPPTGGYTGLSVTFKVSREGFAGDSSQDFCLTMTGSTASNLPEMFDNKKVFPAVPLDTWSRFDTTFSGGAFGKMSVMRTVTSWHNLGMVIDEVMMYPPASKKIIRPLEFISPDGGATKYRVLKVLQDANHRVKYVLDTPYVGASGSYDVTRVYSPLITNERPMIANIDAASTTSSPYLGKIKRFTGNIQSLGDPHALMGLIQGFTTTFVNSSVVSGALGRFSRLTGSVSGSGIVQAGISKVNSFVSSVTSIGGVSAIEYIRFKFFDSMITSMGTIGATLGKQRYLAALIEAIGDVPATRTRLQLFTSEAITAAHSVIIGGLGYAKALSADAIVAVSDLYAGAAEVWRGMSGAIVGTGDVPAHLVLDLQLGGAIAGSSDFSATPAFFIGLNPVDVFAHSGVLSGKLTKESLLNALVAAQGDVVIPFDWQPVNIFSATIDASGNVSAFLVRDVPYAGQFVGATDLISTVDLVRALNAGISGDVTVKSWLDVPATIRELIVTSSGVVIGSDQDGAVVFDSFTDTQTVTVRGISIVQLNDLRDNTQQTIVVV